MVLFAKTELNSIKFIISKALIDSLISHDKFFIVNNELKEHDDLRKEI